MAKLKELLTANSVDYTGFLEKAEFIEHAIDLWIHFNLQKDHGKNNLHETDLTWFDVRIFILCR